MYYVVQIFAKTFSPNISANFQTDGPAFVLFYRNILALAQCGHATEFPLSFGIVGTLCMFYINDSLMKMHKPFEVADLAKRKLSETFKKNLAPKRHVSDSLKPPAAAAGWVTDAQEGDS